MAKRLSEYLREIGWETHDTGYLDDNGTVRVITKDEKLAREIWKRALGSEENIINADRNVTCRVLAPDPKAQQFIFERREGKFITPQDGGSVSVVEKISELLKNNSNAIAEQIVNEKSDDRDDS